jgi:hypothetical protein
VEAVERVAPDAEPDDAARVVDVLDRVDRNDAPGDGFPNRST